jgi:predicted permease
MASIREWLSRLAGPLWRRRGDAGLRDEIQDHLARLEESYRAAGYSAEDARRRARVAFGNPALVRENYQAQRTVPAFGSIARDVRYAVRLFRRSPAFTLTAVLTLALGIGLNTTLFTTIDAVMFRPLPVRDGARLVRFERWFASQRLGNLQYLFSWDEYRYAADHGPLADLAAASMFRTVTANDVEVARLQTVSPNYFDVLGSRMAAGRAFTASDGDTTLGIVISDAYWQHRFARDPSVVGRALRLNGSIVTIVGVAPAAFIGAGNPPDVPDAWVPAVIADRVAPAPQRLYQIFGHLRSGDALASAGARAGLLAAPMASAFPVEDATTALTLERASFFGETNDARFRQFVAALMTAVGLVLLIACANLANMLLARASGRQKEIAMRLALGASRARVVRQLLTESVLLALVGGAGGLLLSIWGARVLWVGLADTVQLFLQRNGNLFVSLTPDLRVFAYTSAISAFAGVVFGLSPALRASRADLNSSLKEEGIVAGRGMTRSWLRSVLVGGQVAVSMALLLAAGLLLRGFDAARRADPGYDASRLYAVLFPRPADKTAATALQERVFQRLSRVPELSTVALADRMPMAGTWTPPVGVRRGAGSFVSRTLANHASPEYFAALDIPIVRGRNFAAHEHGNFAIVSGNAAKLLWPGQEPLGRTLTLDMDFRNHLKTFEVIGVARDVRTANLSRVDPSFVYLPVERAGADQVIVRIATDPERAIAAMREALREIDADMVVRTEFISVADGPMRFQAMTMTALTAVAATLALVALVLAVVGIYGVVSYLAAARRFEIGVRMALGARGVDALALVMADSFRPVIAGAVIGIGAALALSSLLRSSLSFPGTPDVLFGVNAFDPVSFLGATALLAGVALAASAGPLWRSTRVDPVIALRQ